MSKKATKKSKKSVLQQNDPLHWAAITKLSSVHALREILSFSGKTLPELSARCNISFIKTHSDNKIGILRNSFSDFDFTNVKDCFGNPDAELPSNIGINKFVFEKTTTYEMDTFDDLWDLYKIFEDGTIEFSYDKASWDVYGRDGDFDGTTYKSSFRVSIARIKRLTPIFDSSGKKIGDCDCLITLDSREADLYNLTEETIKKFTDDYEKILSEDPDAEINDDVSDFYDAIINGVISKGKYFGGLEDEERHMTFRYILEVKVKVDNPESLILKLRTYELTNPKPTRIILLVKEIDDDTKRVFDGEGFPVHLWSKIDGLDEAGSIEGLK